MLLPKGNGGLWDASQAVEDREVVAGMSLNAVEAAESTISRCYRGCFCNASRPRGESSDKVCLP
jgi:hypothetical protein